MLVETAGVDSPLFPFLLLVLWCTMKSSKWVAGNTWRMSTQPSTSRTRGKQQSEQQCGILARGVNSRRQTLEGGCQPPSQFCPHAVSPHSVSAAADPLPLFLSLFSFPIDWFWRSLRPYSLLSSLRYATFTLETLSTHSPKTSIYGTAMYRPSRAIHAPQLKR